MKSAVAGLASFLRFCVAMMAVLAVRAGEPGVRAVATFECAGLYWSVPDGSADKLCEVSYRAAGAPDWRSALPLWFDERDHEYRGSVVNLRPGTTYEIALRLKGASSSVSVEARTWSEVFPVRKTVELPEHSTETLVVAESGSAEGYVVYAGKGGSAGAIIDVGNKADQCVVVKGSRVILRGLTLRNGRIHGVLLGEGVHDVVIEECDISGWGRTEQDGWGKDYDSAIYSKSQTVKRVIVQRNRIHHPRSNSNNWREPRPRPGKREPSHPEGPQAVCLWDSEGNHVIRYNTVWSDEAHQYNDIFGAGQNFSRRGFPNRDSDIYGNLLSHCWDDAIESEGANCNVRIWGNYMTDVFVGAACASTSIGPLYVWRNVTGTIRESPGKTSGAFLKTSDRVGGGRIFVFNNTILQPVSAADSTRRLGATVGLGWGGPMTNVMSRNNILDVTRQAFAERGRLAGNDFDYDLFSAPFKAAGEQEKRGRRGSPVYAKGSGIRDGKGMFGLAPDSPGFDGGVMLPNFTDGFSGAAPDMGASEAGAEKMEFGVDAYRKTGTH